MEADKKWYVIHTYSGYENKVKTTLELKVQSMGLQDVISRILVPLEDEIDEKDGVKKVVKRKIFPGYVLVEMEVNDRSWYVVRNTPGVTGFVGSATKPVPLSDSEVEHILKSQGLDKKPTINVDVEVGETVRITSGAQEEISELNNIVSMFLDYAENQARRKNLMMMDDWSYRLDSFLQFNEYDILSNAGKISKKVADNLAKEEFKKYRIIQDREFKSDFDKLTASTMKKK